MLNLLAKDFKLLFGKDRKKVISIIFTIFFGVLFIILEVFLYTTILNKIKTTKDAPIAFTTLFLFVISVVIILSLVVNSNKLFFNEQDKLQLSPHPIDEIQVVTSKIIFLFVSHFALSFVTSFPIFIAYASVFPKTMMFYYLAIFYPVITFFFNCGVALILVYPFYIIKKFLNKHIIIRFITIAIILFILCFLYTSVLNVFIEIVIGGNFNFILTKVPTLVNISKYFFPTTYIVKAMFQNISRHYLPFICISFGVFCLGVGICIFTYNYVKNTTFYKNKKIEEKKLKVKSITKALVDKEIKLLTKNSEFSFSYLGLLVVEPLLVYLVINAMNKIFTTGVFQYYVSILPNFIPLLDILLLMFFTLIILQGANTYIQMEKKTIKVMKTIPVSFKKQIIIKVLIPSILSFIAFIISILILLIFKVINVTTFIFGIILVTILLITYNLASLKEELSIRAHKPKNTVISNLYAYLLPVLYFIITAFLSFYNLPLIISYIAGIIVLSLILVIYIIYINKNLNKMFLDLDVIN